MKLDFIFQTCHGFVGNRIIRQSVSTQHCGATQLMRKTQSMFALAQGTRFQFVKYRSAKQRKADSLSFVSCLKNTLLKIDGSHFLALRHHTGQFPGSYGSPFQPYSWVVKNTWMIGCLHKSVSANIASMQCDISSTRLQHNLPDAICLESYLVSCFDCSSLMDPCFPSNVATRNAPPAAPLRITTLPAVMFTCNLYGITGTYHSCSASIRLIVLS